MESDVVTMQDIFVAKPVEDNEEAARRQPPARPAALHRHQAAVPRQALERTASSCRPSSSSSRPTGSRRPESSAFGGAPDASRALVLGRRARGACGRARARSRRPTACLDVTVDRRALPDRRGDRRRRPRIKPGSPPASASPRTPSRCRACASAPRQHGRVHRAASSTARTRCAASRSWRPRRRPRPSPSAKRPADQIAVFTFGKTVQTLPAAHHRPGHDRQRLGQVSIDAAPGTALNDAIVTGSRAPRLGRRPARDDRPDRRAGQRLHVASADSWPSRPPRRRRLTVYAIALAGSTPSTRRPLERLATATGGTFYEADARPPRSARSTRRSTRTCARPSRSSTVSTATRRRQARGRARRAAGSAKTRTTPAGSRRRATKTSAGAVAALRASRRSRVGPGASALGRAHGCFAVLVAAARSPRPLTKRIEPTRARSAADGAVERDPATRLGEAAFATERVLGQPQVLEEAWRSPIEHADLPLRTAELFYMHGRRRAARLGSRRRPRLRRLHARARCRLSALTSPYLLREAARRAAPQGVRRPAARHARRASPRR